MLLLTQFYPAVSQSREDIKTVIDSILLSDTIVKGNIDLVKNQAYYLILIDEVKFQKKNYTIYSFGNGASHSYLNYLLFIRRDRQDIKVIGLSHDCYSDLSMLSSIMNQVTGLSPHNVSKCYSLIINNFAYRGRKGSIIKRE